MNSGVNLTLTARTPAAFQKAGMLSPAGRCRTLDAAADGYTRAEAAVMMLLRLRARDPASGPEVTSDGEGARSALAVLLLRGSGVNQDGRSSALTAPNGPAQQAVIRAALSMGGIPASDVTALQVMPSHAAWGTHAEAAELLLRVDSVDSPSVACTVKEKKYKK